MPPVLPTALNSSHHPFVLLQSSAAQSAVSILRAILKLQAGKGQVLLVSTLYAPGNLLNNVAGTERDNVRVYDWTSDASAYSNSPLTLDQKWTKIRDYLDNVLPRPLAVVIDSVDDLGEEPVEDIYRLLRNLVRHKSAPRLVCNVNADSSLLPLIQQPAFSPALLHIVPHSPAIIHYIASEFLTPPPPLSPFPKFWRVFLSLTERQDDVDNIIFGNIIGTPSFLGEIVVEVLDRSREGASGRRQGVERVLQGWKDGKPCELAELLSLKKYYDRKVTRTQGNTAHVVSFNLNLTDSQRESRSQVPLPYAHEGGSTPTPVIFYDPDSADDLDDEDPDEDLDI